MRIDTLHGPVTGDLDDDDRLAVGPDETRRCQVEHRALQLLLIDAHADARESSRGAGPPLPHVIGSVGVQRRRSLAGGDLSLALVEYGLDELDGLRVDDDGRLPRLTVFRGLRR